MKTLYFVRHSKSSWEVEAISDMDRTLNERGIQDAVQSAQFLREQGRFPEVVLSSPANRALHTALIFSRILSIPYSALHIYGELYSGSLKDIEILIRSLPKASTSAMLFGHNPTFTDFVNRCLDHRIDKIPTTGIVALQFKTDYWDSIEFEAELQFIDYPKKRK
jgi:phosphohistidine phosphatase